MSLLEVKDLAVHFYTDEGVVEAIRDISFTVNQGDTLGIIGESGCGKSVTALSVMGLLPGNGRVVKGEILFKGTNIVQLDEKARARLRGSEMTIVFQDALSSLNPVFTVETQLSDILRVRDKRRNAEQNHSAPKKDYRAEIIQRLKQVGISAPDRRIRQYIHELSGGMRQRIMIAMALACQPQLLIADEPTTALDVTTEAQIVELIRTVLDRFEVTFILITHDLSMVAELCNRIVVLYRGNSVEETSVETLFKRPLHPYTQGLMQSILTLDTQRGKLQPIEGAVPNPHKHISGCQFHPRCPEAMDICRQASPRFVEVEPGHRCACFLHSSEVAEPSLATPDPDQA